MNMRAKGLVDFCRIVVSYSRARKRTNTACQLFLRRSITKPQHTTEKILCFTLHDADLAFLASAFKHRWRPTVATSGHHERQLVIQTLVSSSVRVTLCSARVKGSVQVIGGWIQCYDVRRVGV
jgi:hypothetical protein